MRRCVAAVLLVLGLLGAARGAEIDLNPPYGSALYLAPSVFAPDLAAGEPLGPRVVVVLHGFGSAVPNGTYKRLRELLGGTHTVIGVNYEWFEVERTRDQLDALAAGWLAGRDVTVVGTSLGGWWADWLANRIGARAILSNPVTDPAEHMMKYAGRAYESARRARTYRFTGAEIARYAALAVEPDPGVPVLVVLTEDDDRVDHRKALALYGGRANATVRVWPTGGHTVDFRSHPAREVVRAFVLGE